MKKLIPYIIIVILLLFIIWQNCPGNKSTIKVEVPEVKGSFPAVKPDTKIIEIPVNHTVKDTAEINRLKNLYNLSQEEVVEMIQYNQKVEDLAACTKDSLTNTIVQLSKYQEFSYPFENDTLKVLVTGLSQGPVKRVGIPDFIIKKRTVDVPQKEIMLRVIAGGEFGINKELNQGTWKVNLTIQDQGNNLYTGSFQKILGQDFWLAGFQKSIFSINKKEKKNVEQK